MLKVWPLAPIFPTPFVPPFIIAVAPSAELIVSVLVKVALTPAVMLPEEILKVPSVIEPAVTMLPPVTFPVTEALVGIFYN